MRLYEKMARSLLPEGSWPVIEQRPAFLAQIGEMPCSCPYLEHVLAGRPRPHDMRLLKQGLADGTTKPNVAQWERLKVIVKPLWGDGITIADQ